MQKSAGLGEMSTRWWDVPAAILVFAAVTVSGLRLTITRWTPDLAYALNLGLLATLIGFALGKSRFGRKGVIWLSIGYMLILIPNQLIAELDRGIYLGERLLSTGNRLLFSIGEFFANKPVEDYLLFVTFLCIVYWFVGLTAGYYFVRHADFLATMLPAGVVLMTIHIYDHFSVSRIWLVALFLFICLLLLGRQYYLFNRLSWTKRHVHLSAETVQDLSLGMVVGATVIILISWNLPQAVPYARSIASEWDQITRPWDRFLNRMNDAVASVKNNGIGGSGAGYYGNQLALGTSNPLSTEIVFKVLVPENSNNVPRFYWRSRVYDTFASGEWSTSPTRSDPFSPVNQEFNIPDTEQRQQGEFSFTVLTPSQSMLFTPPQPLWVSRPADMLEVEIPQGKQDIITVLASPALQRNEIYRVRSSLANPSIQELREAGENYPDWVEERYLQLPSDLSPRLRKLAENLAKDLNTPYDKANVITNYLRSNIEYSTGLEIPNDVPDPLEYAVMDLKKGFCTYYASAEVLILRAVGIPARMAVGYAQGEINADESQENIVTVYVVRRRDAHAWPEIYFPGYGWIEFEPTGNQDALIRPEVTRNESVPADSLPIPLAPSSANQNLLDKNQELEGLPGGNPAPNNQVNLYVIAGLTGMLLVIASVYMERKYSLAKQLPLFMNQVYTRNGAQPPKWIGDWAQWSSLSSIERSFQSINISLGILRASQPIHSTPGQRAVKLIELLPEARDAIEALEIEHRNELFTPRPGNPVRARRAALLILYRTVRNRTLQFLGYNYPEFHEQQIHSHHHRT